MLKQAKSKNEINVFGFLKHIRTQRYSLVQTEEQYIFIHDALQEAIESGETNIPIENLLHHVQEMLLSSNTKTDPWNSLEAQYKVNKTKNTDFCFLSVIHQQSKIYELFYRSQLVTAWKPKDFNLVSATKACNVNKNRNPEIVPIETARVHLTPKAGIDGSDYINATWFPGNYFLSRTNDRPTKKMLNDNLALLKNVRSVFQHWNFDIVRNDRCDYCSWWMACQEQKSSLRNVKM